MRIIEFQLKPPLGPMPRDGDYFGDMSRRLPNRRRAERNSHVARTISQALGVTQVEAAGLMGKTVRVTDAQFGVLAATLLAECGIVPIVARSVAFVTPSDTEVVDLTGRPTPALQPATASRPAAFTASIPLSKAKKDRVSLTLRRSVYADPSRPDHATHWSGNSYYATRIVEPDRVFYRLESE